MSERRVDVIVVGGGHNGLVAAAYLAKGGATVLVLERRPRPGGVAVTEEIHPGFRVDTVLHDAGMFRPGIVRELFLKMHDLEFLPAGVHTFAPLPSGDHLTLWPDPAQTAAAIRRLSPRDADRFVDYAEKMTRYAAFVETALARVPPNPGQLADLSGIDMLRWLGLARKFRGLGEREMYGLLRLLPLSVYEWMTEWFADEAVQAVLGAAGVWHLHQGPRAGGTAFNLLYHSLGRRAGGLPATGRVRGGIGKLAEVLATAAHQFGAEIRTDADVARVRLENGRATGVVLADGEEIGAGVVLAATNPRHTFTELVPPVELPPSLNRAVQNIRFRGVAAKVNLALDRLPVFTALPAGETHLLHGHVHIGPSLDAIEQAYDAAKYGGFSPRPVLDVTIPSLTDRSLAPAGKHVMSILAQYAPYHLRDTTWDAQREALGDAVVETLAQYAPDLPDAILARRVLTPADLEAVYGAPEGSLYHGEMGLDQLLFMRPVPGWGDYRTPIEGLFQCGAGTHPGGGITGEPGRLAAQVVAAVLAEGQ